MYMRRLFLQSPSVPIYKDAWSFTKPFQHLGGTVPVHRFNCLRLCSSRSSNHFCAAIFHVYRSNAIRLLALTPSTSTYMGLDTASNATQLIGAASGVFFAGGLIGALLQARQSDKLGRQNSVALSCAVAVLGGALQAGSVHIAMFIAARMIAGLGVGKRARDMRM